MDIRRYRTEDNQAIRDLHVRALTAIGAFVESGSWDADFDDVEGVYLRGGEFLVGTIEGRIVAMGALRPAGPERGEIKRMRTDPALQGRGYGQTILSLLEDKAQQLGFTALQLDTGEIQKAAQHLYEKNGYKEVRRDLLGKYPSIFYEKVL